MSGPSVSARASRGSHAFFAVVALLALGVTAARPRVFASLVFERHGVLQGEAWRLLTAHLVHAGPVHLLLNLAGLALVWLAFGSRLTGAGWVTTGAASALASALGVLLLHPEVRAMAGLSATLHGLLAAGSVAAIRSGDRLGWLFLAILATKLAWEPLAGGSVAPAALGGPVALQAHRYGALAGALCGLALTRPRA
jgi:rhomboid family GlyGly-CTERM serine protease